MTTRFAFRALLAGLALSVAAMPAAAAFHTFRIAEVFSSIDGTVQYIRVHENSGANSQNAWAGLTITCTSGGTTHTFTFPTPLPSSATSGKDVLIATSNFGGLVGGVTPDYTIPAGFVITTGGTLNFANVSTVNYAALPGNGVQSVTAAGGVITNAPRNFAGLAGSVNVPPGSCCVAAACSVSVQISCSGTWAAAGTCSPSPCSPPPQGLCCSGVTCRIDTAANCAGLNTAFAATGTCNAAGNNTAPCCKADFNKVNAITVQDIFDYLNAWFAGNLQADIDNNGAGPLAVQDIFDFLNAWFVGC